MAELVGGAILTSAIQVLVERLASPEVANFFRKNHSASQLLEKLQVTLWSANSLLNDADDKELKDVNVKNWVDKLSEVLNEADNTLDDINTKALRCEIEGKEFLKKLIPTALNLFERTMKEKLEEIIGRLEFLLGQKDRLGLKEGVQSKRLERSPAPLIENSSFVYGRDGDKEAILELLFSENISGQDKISVIPIVGMGGVGKTTLARLVYDDSRVKDHFEHRAWVTVSDDFDVLKLAKHFLEGLGGKECEVKELGKLGEELEKLLGGKKFLLVLDDVWNENYNRWNSLRSYFQVGSVGSKIIVTTRNEEIGSKMGSVPSHPLTPMSDDDCWKLFQKHAFRSIEASTKHVVETIGSEIVKKCKGLPLAVMSLAGLLCSVSDPKEWEKVLKSDVWELQRKGDDEILPSLWLSYSYLPSNSKRCFAYCSIFPKDFEYEKEKIILLWMAEGLVQGDNMEDEGEEFFKSLVSISLLQRSPKDESNFVMHDLVHDLATFVSGKGFCTRLGKGGGLEHVTSKTRHLLFEGCFDDLKGLSGANNLRTFISSSCMGGQVVRKIPTKFGYLRVLCLSSLFIGVIGKLPDSIGKLKHLRYLDLSGTSIKRLPDTICTLYNLQTLLLRQCCSLTHLPAKMEWLINLRHLDISETISLKEIPQSVYKLKALRTINKFVVGSGSRINRLKKFSHLRGCLEISGLENIVETKDVLEAEFKEKSVVTELILCWDRGSKDATKDRLVLDALKPHPNLKKLSIRGYGGIEFSDWIANHSFSNVTEVSLENCKHCIQLPPFGQLPCLKKLQVTRLESVETIGSEFYGSSGATPFPCLKTLQISHMNELQSWSFKVEGAFPCLEELTLSGCRKLEFTGLPFPSSLKELSIDDCNMVYAQRMKWGLKALTKLTIERCNIADSFPEEGVIPTTLTHLEIRTCEMLKTICLDPIHCLPSLKKLSISGSPKLEFTGLPFPSSLKELTISNCNMVCAQRMQWGLKALTKLTIERCNIADSFPEEGLLPTTLTELNIWIFLNLKSLNGKAFQHLTSLKMLTIGLCPELQSLPEEGLPASLERLQVFTCQILTPRLKRETGEDWHKISHILNTFVG